MYIFSKKAKKHMNNSYITPVKGATLAFAAQPVVV